MSTRAPSVPIQQGDISKPNPNSSSSNASSSAGAPAVTKRLQNELMQLVMSGDKGITAFPQGDSLFNWVATIHGPLDTLYQGLTFKLLIKFPSDYPFSAPTITFTTPCFHPNVDTYGNICLDILKDKWSASYSVSTILHSIRSLLSDPNIDSPLNSTAAALWSRPEEYQVELLKVYNAAGNKN